MTSGPTTDPSPATTVNTPGGKAGSLQQVGDPQRRECCLHVGLHHNAITPPSSRESHR